MDDELLKLEAELKQLRPAEPSLALEQQLERALCPRRARVFRVRWAWLALPVAAAVTIIVATATPRQVAKSAAAISSAPATFKPITAENVLLSSRDEGYVTMSDGTPARRVRQTYLDKITWKNPKTNASLTWSLPREEVRVIPMILQ